MKRKWFIVFMASLVLVGIVASGVFATQEVDIRFKGNRLRAYVHKDKVPWRIRIVPRQKSERKVVKSLFGLNLTPEQEKELAKLRINLEKETLQLRFQLKEKQLKLKELLLEDSPVKEKIEAVIDEMGSAWTEVKKKSINFWMKLKNVLTEEQWTKLDQKEGYRFFPRMGGKQKMRYHFW